jgi:Flp pilus assembly protein TadD
MIQARAMQRRGGGDNPQGAVALYRKIITLVPGSAQAYLRLSEAIMETGGPAGNIAAAVEPAVKASELDPANGEVWAHLGLLYFFQAQTQEAARPLAAGALRRAVKLLPGDAELWTRYAEIQETLKDEEGALKAWLSVGRLHPTATYRNRVLAEFAWERALELSMKLKQYEPRREAVLALCDERYPDRRHLKFLEDLARDQVDAGFLGHAAESFELLAHFVPTEPAIWENIAIIQLRTNRFDTALVTLAKAETMHTSSRLSFHIGLCLMKLGRFKEAEQRWVQLLPTLGTSAEDQTLAPSVKVLYATCLLLQARPQEMLDKSASWPEALAHPELLGLRAQAFIQTGAWKEARTALKLGMEAFPAHEVFQRAKDLPPQLFEEGVIFKAESRKALSQLNLEAMAGLWAEFHSWEHCLEMVRLARKTAPVRDVELLLLEANALESLGRSEQAMLVLREGQKLNPGHPTLQNNLGFLLLERGGDLKEATRLIEASLAQEPKNSSTMDSWGWALYKNGRYAESEDVLRKAAALSPFSPEVHRHLGEALVKLNRPQDALEEWDRALAFAFPERKVLEDQARELRTRLAKARNAQADDVAEPDPPTADDVDEVEP